MDIMTQFSLKPPCPKYQVLFKNGLFWSKKGIVMDMSQDFFPIINHLKLIRTDMEKFLIRFISHYYVISLTQKSFKITCRVKDYLLAVVGQVKTTNHIYDKCFLCVAIFLKNDNITFSNEYLVRVYTFPF